MIHIFNQIINAKKEYSYQANDIPSIPAELIAIGSSGQWDDAQIFSMAKYPRRGTPGPGDIIYYGGGQGADNQEIEVGAFDVTDFETGSKDVNNPIITRSGIGLGGASEGFAPMDVWVDGSTIYLFGSVFGLNGSDFEADIGYITASTSSPKSFSGLTRVIENGGLGHYNHSCCIDTDPGDSSKLLMFYAFRNTSSDALRINVARAAKTDLNTWSLIYSDVVGITNSTPGQVYPWWWYENGRYRLMYGRFSPSGNGTFAVYYTSSEDLSSFPEGGLLIDPTGNPGDFDQGYTSTPHKFGDYVYYSGRGTGDEYIGIGVKELVKI